MGPAAAQDNFAAWNRALEAKRLDVVAALYDTQPLLHDLDLLASLTPVHGSEEGLCSESNRDYLAYCITKFPYAEVTCQKTTAFGPGAYLHTGMYTFMVAVARGRERSRDPLNREPARPMTPREAAKVRFSYLWSRADGTWRIVHHHSSFNLSPFSSGLLPQQPHNRTDADADHASQFVSG